MKKLYIFCTILLCSLSHAQGIPSFKSTGNQNQYVPVVFNFVNRPFSISRPSIHEDRDWLAYGIATINGIGNGWGSGNNMLKLENFTHGVLNNDNTGGFVSYIGKVNIDMTGTKIIVFLRGNTTYYTDGSVFQNNGSYYDQAINTTLSAVNISEYKYNVPRGVYVSEWEINAKSKSLESTVNTLGQISYVNGNYGIGTSTPQFKLEVNGNFNVFNGSNHFLYDGGADIILRHAGRGSGGRAIVHNSENILSLNYGNDFSGGTKIGSTLLVKQNDASLQGKFEAKEVKVTTSPTADFVFEEDYKLPKLEEVEDHIKTKKHLPEIASAKEMEKEGVNIGEFQIKLLQKIEELTLYSIEQNKQIKALKEDNKQLKLQSKKIEELEKRLNNKH